jgi:hypothetical protein
MLARVRRLSRRRVLQEGAAATAAAAGIIALGICCYAAVAWGAHSTLARNVGAACFLAVPLVVAAILKVGSGRWGLAPGSVAGAILFGLAAFVAISVWAILYLKGPLGWGTVDLLVSTPSFVLIYSAASCFGWWCGRSIRQANA